MDAEQNKSFKLEAIRALIKTVESIDPSTFVSGDGSKELTESDANKLGLLLVEQLKQLATTFNAGRAEDAQNAAQRLHSLLGPDSSLAANNELRQQIEQERSDIMGQGIAASPAAPSLDLERQEMTVAELSNWKWTLLFVLYALEFAVLYGLEASIWNLIRQLGGISFTDPKRIGTEIAAAVVVALTIPDFQRLLRHVLDRAGGAPAFEGDVNIITEHVEMIVSGFFGGGAINAGVHLATALAGENVDMIRYIMFLGYFSAFLCAGFVNAAGQLALGRKLVIGPKGEPFPNNAKEALSAFGQHYVKLDILLYERLVHFVNWFLYNFYGAGFGDGELALGGSLWLFVALFKVSFFWTEKARKRFG